MRSMCCAVRGAASAEQATDRIDARSVGPGARFGVTDPGANYRGTNRTSNITGQYLPVIRK